MMKPRGSIPGFLLQNKKIFYAFTVHSNGILRELKTPVNISASSSLQKFFNVDTNSLRINAIWDTGATRTVIIEEAARKLKLKPITQTTIKTVGSPPSLQNVYLINLMLPNNVIAKNIKVTAAESIGSDDVGCLIGMDIIALGDFSISFVNQKDTCFSFRLPSFGNKIDFVEEINNISKTKEKKKHKMYSHGDTNKRKKNRRKK